MNKGQFKPGQSGNPHGRPPKSRALTEILERRGNSTRLDIDGKRHAGKQIVARALWELVTTGKTTLQDGEEVKMLEVHSKGWFEIVKWLYAQIDGPPKSELAVNADVQSLNIDFTKLTTAQLETIAKGGSIADALKGNE